jgi:hypothetical protein
MDIETVLNNLGNTAEEVAANLVAAKVKGDRYSTCHCPIAKYLIQQGFIAVVVGVDSLGYYNKVFGHRVDVKIPKPVSEFIQRFDTGYIGGMLYDTFPELRPD